MVGEAFCVPAWLERADAHHDRRFGRAVGSAACGVQQAMSADEASAKITAGMRGLHVRNELKKGNTDKFADADHAAKVAAKKGKAAEAEGDGAPAMEASEHAAEVEAASSGVAEAVVDGEPAAASEPAAVASTEVSAGREGCGGGVLRVGIAREG